MGRVRVDQEGSDSVNACFFANELPVAGWFVFAKVTRRGPPNDEFG